MAGMDELLKRLAEASLAQDAAEEALEEGEATQASEHLDEVDAILADLRDRWKDMSAPERKIVGSNAAPLRERLDRARRRLPKRSALSEAAPEVDPEQEADPEAS
jgi:hypothetical protein